jgi:hypothetical protein
MTLGDFSVTSLSYHEIQVALKFKHQTEKKENDFFRCLQKKEVEKLKYIFNRRQHTSTRAQRE